MNNYYKPRYKKWLRNGKIIFDNKVSKIDNFNRKKWLFFKIRNRFLKSQSLINFEKKLRLESAKKFFKNGLIQKQILKNFYGDISEKQFKKLIRKSNLYNSKSNYSLIVLLESRLDICLYRLNFTKSLPEARQLISHKHILVNNSIANSKGHTLKPGDLIQISVKSLNYMSPSILANITKTSKSGRICDVYTTLLGNHLQMDYRTLSVIFVEYPNVDEIMFPFEVNLKRIKEFYNI